ncbi:MAG TPA: AAA family ATPase [Gammaproteobacteria bacterium]|nr:AAA family ATPase [Gammaproteobacteria bacterium]
MTKITDNRQSPTNMDAHKKTSDCDSLLKLWNLRILTRLNVFNRFFDRYGGLHDPETMHVLGLSAFLHDENVGKKDIFSNLSNTLKSLESDTLTSPQDVFSVNISVLQKSLNLTQCEIDILRFVIVSGSSAGFNMVVETLGEMSNEQIRNSLSIILNVPRNEIDNAMRTNGTLISSGLLRINTSGHYMHSLQQCFDVPHSIKYALTQEQNNPGAILQCFFKMVDQSHLSIEDFPHLTADIDLLTCYLQSAEKKNIQGINVLIYGEPGTGKTELVKTLSQYCGFELYEITMQDMEGNPIDGKDRFAAYQLTQKMLANKEKSAILFDEIEDAFPDVNFSPFGHVTRPDFKKAWVHQLLEENSIPAFWLCNSVVQLDDSVLRRFDFVLNLRSPTRNIRRRILDKYLGHLNLSEAWLAQMAEHEHLVPAHAESAAKIAAHLNDGNTKALEKNLERIIGNKLQVLGLSRKPRTVISRETRYSLEYLNPDQDLEALTRGLQQNHQARICLYGAPGTGKTAFAHYVAEQLDKPLLKKQASDILSKWVGEAEQNIAAMFDEAEADDMVLLVDEVDSFLLDRGSSQNSWEITQVNELLVQMESFNGVFIASTNLLNLVDAASLRRFDLKIKFDCMKPQQAWALFLQILEEHGCTVEDEMKHWKTALARFDNLTPGDFATVVRQSRSLNKAIHPRYLLNALEKECRAKPGAGKSIGFMG